MSIRSIKTLVFPVIFAAVCLVFGLLFIGAYRFAFTSVDQIFSRQTTSKLGSITQVVEENESEHRNAVRILYLNRNSPAAVYKNDRVGTK